MPPLPSLRLTACGCGCYRRPPPGPRATTLLDQITSESSAAPARLGRRRPSEVSLTGGPSITVDTGDGEPVAFADSSTRKSGGVDVSAHAGEVVVRVYALTNYSWQIPAAATGGGGGPEWPTGPSAAPPRHHKRTQLSALDGFGSVYGLDAVVSKSALPAVVEFCELSLTDCDVEASWWCGRGEGGSRHE